jgi:hypothetical protein
VLRRNRFLLKVFAGPPDCGITKDIDKDLGNKNQLEPLIQFISIQHNPCKV